MEHSKRSEMEELCFPGRPQAAFNPHSSETEAVDGKYSSSGSLHHVSMALDIWMMQK